jgi:hypothetical protein
LALTAGEAIRPITATADAEVILPDLP